jgi:hypothetical protein
VWQHELQQQIRLVKMQLLLCAAAFKLRSLPPTKLKKQFLTHIDID